MPVDASWDRWSAVAATVLVGYLVVVIPLTGRRRYGRLRAAPVDLPRVYRRSMRRQWLLAVVAVGLVAAAGVPLGDLGVTPGRRDLGGLGPNLAVLIGAGLVLALVLRRRPAAAARLLRPAAALLPRTRQERRAFALVALTAGITEELLYRGFLLLYLVEVFPGLSVGTAAGVSAVLFGLAHAYQGWTGMLLTGLAGYGLAGLYLTAGGLLVPVVVHALVDLRVLLVLPTAPDEPAAADLPEAA